MAANDALGGKSVLGTGGHGGNGGFDGFKNRSDTIDYGDWTGPAPTQGPIVN
ncbi:hypothetical protein ACIPUC_00645 [Streptomyces sp. LARHCF249]